ncbi:MAG: hypothetical protein WAN50_04600 [Minisyncoccia bacterium]
MESFPKQNEHSGKTEKDPRVKSGLDDWARSLLKRGVINQDVFDAFIVQNNSKEQNMQAWRVPQLKHYGFFTSEDEIREKLSSLKGEKFIIRCVSKKDGKVTRLLDVTLEEACEFAEKLEGGFDAWNVEMKEFAKTKAAGTIIVNASGRAMIEMWHGPHYMNVKGATEVPKYSAILDPDQFHHGFHWSGPQDSTDLSEMQRYAIDALRYLFPHLKPRENDPVYAEYGVRPDDSIYFIEVSNSPLLTGEFWKMYSRRSES